MVGLPAEEYGHRRPRQLSGGQRQRVALVRALAPDPVLLLLDEPLGALDARLRQQMQVELKHIQRRTGKAFVFVTHDQEEALTMSDVIIVMNNGRIEQQGSPEDLYHRPRSRFVADFIGETNLLEARVTGRDGDLLRLDWNGAAVTGSAPPDAPHDGIVHVSIRPENIHCSRAEPDHANRFRGRIRERIFKGARTVLQVAVEPGGTLAVHTDRTMETMTEGEELWLGFAPDRTLVLVD